MLSSMVHFCLDEMLSQYKLYDLILVTGCDIVANGRRPPIFVTFEKWALPWISTCIRSQIFSECRMDNNPASNHSLGPLRPSIRKPVWTTKEHRMIAKCWSTTNVFSFVVYTSRIDFWDSDPRSWRLTRVTTIQGNKVWRKRGWRVFCLMRV